MNSPPRRRPLAFFLLCCALAAALVCPAATRARQLPVGGGKAAAPRPMPDDPVPMPAPLPSNGPTAGRVLLTFAGHSDGIWCASFSPDGRRVVTGSLGHTAKVWVLE